MSDVEAGGATVFTRLNLSLWPRKGSAAFWYNLLPHGDLDKRTRHAACPVLTGNKWGMTILTKQSSILYINDLTFVFFSKVSNKWIHEGAQHLRRPCHLGIHDE